MFEIGSKVWCDPAYLKDMMDGVEDTVRNTPAVFILGIYSTEKLKLEFINRLMQVSETEMQKLTLELMMLLDEVKKDPGNIQGLVNFKIQNETLINILLEIARIVPDIPVGEDNILTVTDISEFPDPQGALRLEKAYGKKLIAGKINDLVYIYPDQFLHKVGEKNA